MPRPRKLAPLLIAGALLTIGAILILVLRPDPEQPAPGDPLPHPLLAALGEVPPWPDLAKYDGVLTRAAFEAALRNVYVLGNDWHCTLTDEAVTIHSQLQPGGQVVQFAPADRPAPAPPPRYWRPLADLPPAPADKPLQGIRIAIDPGHLGGQWARMEERWYQIGDSEPVTEGDLTLRTAHLLRPRLEQLGAVVTMVRSTTEPVTNRRPRDFAAYAARRMPAAPAEQQRKLAEKLFYRTDEIRARAHLVNATIKPDLILCLHFNAENWGEDPKAPVLTDLNHFHLILHGAYMNGEIAHEDERFEMMHKIFQGVHAEEAALAAELARSFATATQLPTYRYPPRIPVTNKRLGPGLYIRNLLANRLYQCPVLFFEPYVMNSHDVYARVQAGDYQGEREVAGKTRKSIYREYVHAVVTGLKNYYESRSNRPQ